MADYPEHTHDEVLGMLWSIPPNGLDYNDELRVTAAAISAGVTEDEALSWCQQSPNFDELESLKHIRSLTPEGGATIGTLIHFAEQYGWSRDTTTAAHHRPQIPTASAKAEITAPRTPSAPTIDPAHFEVSEPVDREPAEQIRLYLNALFRPLEHFELVTESQLGNNGKWHPAGRHHTVSVKDALTALDNNDEAMSGMFKAEHPEAGVWVGVNPLPAGGAADKDVTAYRFTLLESDKMEKTEQVQFYHDHHVPCAAIVDSGGRSVHAIVRIDARDRDEYDNRVRLLHEYCAANGFALDPANKNPSRLTRLPGVQRGEARQRLLYLETGARHFDEWYQWVKDEQDAERSEYPAIVPMRDMVRLNLKPHAPRVIDGLLRRGWLMLVTAASKRGKTHLVTQLMEALAAGTEWLGHHCEVSSSLLINTEIDPIELGYRLDRPLRLDPLDDDAIGRVATWSPVNKPISLDEIIVYLEAHTTPGQYDVVIIDPMYMLEEGDENNATDMTKFLRKAKCFAQDYGCAVIVTHHHSKGPKGETAAIDRGAGSGVLGRMPDVIIDLTELQVLDTDIEAGTYLDEMKKKNGLPARPFRVSYETRYDPEPEPKNVVLCSPFFYVDTEGHLDSLALVGSQLARQKQGGDTNRKRCIAENNQKTEAILQTIAMCEAEGVKATKNNVYARLEGPWRACGCGKMPARSNFDNFTDKRNTLPFHLENHVMVYDGDTAEDDEEVEDE